MGPSTAVPEADKLSEGLFRHLLSLYPAVLESVYKGKIKDVKKLSSALEDDKWRYEQLPGQLKARSTETGQGSKPVHELKKEELQRLVQWKITHGTFRPFLPGLIRKNEPDTVIGTTRAAFSAQADESYKDVASDKLPPKLTEAIKEVSRLQGVGPATAPLLCSIFDPENVPFFEDELYEWLFPETGKLKYTLKEYQALFHATRKLQKRLGVKAVEVEKVGFVVGHADTLDEGQKGRLKEMRSEQPQDAVDGISSSVSKQKGDGEDAPTPAAVKKHVVSDDEPKTKRPSKTSGKKRASEAPVADPEMGSTRRSKRTKQ